MTDKSKMDAETFQRMKDWVPGFADPGPQPVYPLPRYYRILNWLIRWTGRQYREIRYTRWYPKEGGGIVARSFGYQEYRLASRAESKLPVTASNLEIFMAKEETKRRKSD